MSRSTEMNVFVSNYPDLDPEMYQYWLDGLSESEAAKALHDKSVEEKYETPLDIIASEVADQYRNYNMLEKCLYNPVALAGTLTVQIPPQDHQLLINRYYEIDQPVIRELLGKKLKPRLRKDLDDVSDKTGVSLRSCRRQFDNVKRIFESVEEMQGSVVNNIKKNFPLPDDLARYYGAVVFMNCLRFETSKRKLQYLTFSDFYDCVREIMTHWSYPESSPDYNDLELDKEFLLELKHLKRVDKEKELQYKSLVCTALKPLLSDHSYQDLDANFRCYFLALTGTAASLHHPRELCYLFLRMVEKFIEPWRQASWSQKDVANLLNALSQCFLKLDKPSEVDLKKVWERYMTVMSSCLLRLFHN